MLKIMLKLDVVINLNIHLFKYSSYHYSSGNLSLTAIALCSAWKLWVHPLLGQRGFHCRRQLSFHPSFDSRPFRSAFREPRRLSLRCRGNVVSFVPWTRARPPPHLQLIDPTAAVGLRPRRYRGTACRRTRSSRLRIRRVE